MALFDFRNKKKQEIEVRENTPIDTSAALSVLFSAYNLDGNSTSLSSFFGAMELISNSIAQLPILIKRNNEIDTKHNLNLIFNNMLISKFNFIKMLVSDIILHGNAFCYIDRAKDGTPVNLVYCEHGSVNVFYNQQKQELYYTASFIRKGKIEPVDMIHLYKNSYNGVEGKALVMFANQALKLAKAADKAAFKYYSNGCALQGALTIKGTRKNAKEQARDAFIQTHGEAGSGLVILDDDMTYTPLSSNANDSQMIEARVFNVEEVARFFNINPILLGDSHGYNASTIEAANIEFVQRTLMPYISLIQDEFNRKLVKPSERGIISIDLDETALIKGDKQSTANYLRTLTQGGILSINEARAVLGYKEVEGGDELIIPFTSIKDNQVNNTQDEKSERI